MNTTKQYEIGAESRLFLDALDAFQTFKNQLLFALTETYGEKQGDELWQDHQDRFDAVERDVMDYLRIQFTQQMGAPSTDVVTL